MELNECIEEFNARRQTVLSQQANVFVVCIADIRGGQVIHWLSVENILLSCVYMIEILDSKSKGKLNRYTVDYYV